MRVPSPGCGASAGAALVRFEDGAPPSPGSCGFSYPACGDDRTLARENSGAEGASTKMMNVYRFKADRVKRYPISNERPARFDATGEHTLSSNWVISFTPFSSAPRGERRVALVVRMDWGVTVGARRARGVTELRDGEHVFLDDAEFIFSADSRPVLFDDEPGTSCPVCLNPLGDGKREKLLACPRCTASACDVCWSEAPGGVCITPGCDQPASLDRELWRPSSPTFHQLHGQSRGAGGGLTCAP